MGNAARKERKRGLHKPFQHPVKVKNSLHPSERGKPGKPMSEADFNYIVNRVAGDMGDPSLIAGNAAPEQGVERLPLDPKPYRIGRRRFVDRFDPENGTPAEFSPRKQYDQEAWRYGL
jgi:hypothetical protein